MINNLNYISQTNQNPNKLINTNANVNQNFNNKTKKIPKKVTFKDTIIIYNVESYKELNKLMTYNKEEGLLEYYASRRHPIYDYKSLYDHFPKYHHNPNTRIRKNPTDDCCFIL